MNNINDTFICINIVNDDKTLLYKNYPLVFYWNGENDAVDEIKNDESFKNAIDEFIGNEYYWRTELYIVSVNKDIYNEKEIKIQELYPLDEIDLEKYGFNKMILNIFYDIYQKVFNKKYEIPIDNMSFENILSDIYEEIQKKLDRKISLKTFINYILSVFDEKTKLNYSNKKVLINLIENILKES